MPENSYLSAIEDIKSIAQKFDQVVDRCFSLCRLIMASQAIDRACGTQDQINRDAALVLDSSWIKIAFDSFFIRKQFRSPSNYPTSDLTFVLAIPRDLESVPYIAAPNWRSDPSLVAIAQDQINPLTDEDNIRFEVFGGTHQLGLTQKFFRCLRYLSYFAAALRFWSPPRVGLMELYNLIPRRDFNSLLFFILKGGTLFENSLPSASAQKPIDLALRKRIAEILEIEFLSSGSDWIENQTLAKSLATYISLACPISHCEERQQNWSFYKKTLAWSGVPKKLVTTIGLYYSTFNNFVGALVKQAGGEIISIQHGGYYGYSPITDAEYVEMQCSNRFISWGWNKNIVSKRTYQANIEPLGSHYLFSLQKSRERIPAADILSDRALLCSTDFMYGGAYRTENPVSGEFMLERVWPQSVDAMASWLKKHKLSLDLKAFASNWHGKDKISPYAQMMLDACARHGVAVKLLSPSVPARSIMGNYAHVLWDSVGTGFFESNAIGCKTFLTPAARFAPLLPSGIHLSEAFYVDWQSHEDHSLDTQFKKAKSESIHFMNQFGKVASTSFFDFIKTLN